MGIQHAAFQVVICGLRSYF